MSTRIVLPRATPARAPPPRAPQCRSPVRRVRGDGLPPGNACGGNTASARRGFGACASRANRMVVGKGRRPAEKSMAVAQKEHMARLRESGQHLHHVGIMDGTFVPPTGPNLPSLLAAPRARLAVEKQRFLSLVRYWQGRVMAFWLVKPRLKLERARTPAVAKELYEAMYRAFAAGRLAPVEHRLSPGLASRLHARIRARAPGHLLHWTLHRYLEPPRCVAYAFALPDTHGPDDRRTGLMQAVVRIRSQQSLVHTTTAAAKSPVSAPGVDPPPDALKKDVTEYLVLQRMLVKGHVGEWHAWGTTQEDTWHDVRKKEAQKQDALFGRSAPR